MRLATALFSPFLLAWLSTAVLAQTASLPQASPISGHVRLQHDELQANAGLAHPAAVPTGYATLEAELRAETRGVTAVATLQQRRQDAFSDSRAWFNELYLSHDGGAWQFSAGKKIVAWDVGYGFRPNDMVQQEQRLGLVSSTLEGRPLLVAERFDASTAWSFIWVNPSGSDEAAGGKEPALAARCYQRSGALDWYGFARAGIKTGGSAGMAAAWVASDALELHGSVRLLNHRTSQVLLGGTWTHESQVSLLAEAWRDGTAQLQRNVLLRLSWQHEGWQPALDVLYTPDDMGRAVTASMVWQGNRVQVQGGLRAYGGSADALLMQLPVRQQAYLVATWAF